MSSLVDEFLADVDVRDIPWPRPSGASVNLNSELVLLGPGTDGLEVALATAARAPKADEVRSLWKLRWKRRAAPVLLIVLYTDATGETKAAACGTRDDPAVLSDLDPGNLERIAAAALTAPDPIAAERTLHRLLAGQKDQLVAGLTNQGLFASHELRHGVPDRPDWESARRAGTQLLQYTGDALIRGLGYTLTPIGSTAHALTVGQTRHGVAVLLHDSELFDRPSVRFGTNSPVADGLRIAQGHGLPWLIVTKGTQIRLYPARPDVGVGRKGQSETFAELDLALLSEQNSAFLPLLFGAGALADGGSVAEILAASSEHAAALGHRLRERVYDRVVPVLAVAIGRQMHARTEEELQEAYHRTLLVLFRILFVAYAEDRGLLPYQRNPRYTKKALKTLAKEFTDTPDVTFDTNATDLWDSLLNVWAAVDDGHTEWDVPPYNGGLFAADDAHPSGAAIAAMRLPNSDIGPALKALLIDESPEGAGPVDFRAISVRAYGDVYEGLLESALSIAPCDLTVDTKMAFVPAGASDPVVVAAGEIYFHNSSGARKSTGSYYTREFAVGSLLDSSLEPSIAAHLERVQSHLSGGDDAAAADAFFDFRVVDLAMGSGHFLVAALDRIADRFATFLATHPIAAINDELARLGEVAQSALGSNSTDIEIEPNALLRRQIARRCVYGLDLNLMAVELARLSLWIHTFVPGLPMSSLEHNLVVGNSLTGIGSLPEALEVFEPDAAATGQYSLFGDQIESKLSQAREVLLRLARTTEATKGEVRNASTERVRAMTTAEDAKLLFDAAVGIRLGLLSVPSDPGSAIDQARRPEVQDAVARLRSVHLPFVFPEVFLRDSPGFDVVLGNPPWEKVLWEAASFWSHVQPGLMALSEPRRRAAIAELRRTHPTEAAHEQTEQARRAELQDYFRRSFVLRGGQHLELAQLMLERALTVLRVQGHLGLVLPRGAAVLGGWARLREVLTEEHALRLVLGRNRGGWIFENVHASTGVVLLAAGPPSDDPLRLWVATSAEEVQACTEANALTLPKDEFVGYSQTHIIPWFNDSAEKMLFDRMRRRPRLSAAGEGWITGENNTGWDFTSSSKWSGLTTRKEEPGTWSILMTRHIDPYSINTDKGFGQFLIDFPGAIARGRGLVLQDGQPVLDELHQLVVFRYPSRSDDTRTVQATALPEAGYLPNSGSVHAIKHCPGTSSTALLALIGLMNTNTLDWWSRRFVERHVNKEVINQLPLPDWDDVALSAVAGRAAALLTRGGAQRLAGGIDARAIGAAHADTATERLLAEIEAATLRGFGLDAANWEVIAADFTSDGLPEAHRSAVSALVSVPTGQE